MTENPDVTMTDKSDTQAEDALRFWTREELLIRAESAEAEIDALWGKLVAMHYIDVQVHAEAAEAIALRARVAELEAQPRIEWRPVSEPPELRGDDHWLMCLVVIEGGGYREITTAYFRDGKWLDHEDEPLDDITYWVCRSDLLPDPLRGGDMTQYERTDDKPQWIDAAERHEGVI